MLLYSGHSFLAPDPASDHGCWAEYTTTISSVSSTDSASYSGKKLCCYTRGTPSQPQPQAQLQTMVVGQSIPQQYPQSPAQTVPPTQVRYSWHYFPAPCPASDHGCWAEYTTAVSSVSSTDSHSGKKLCCYTWGTPSQPQLQAQPQTMVVGQSIPQQYPQSPAQTVLLLR